MAELLGEYLNKTIWDNVSMNGVKVPYPVSVENQSTTNRIFEYPVESGKGVVTEFSGREPIKINLVVTIIGKDSNDAETQYRQFKNDMELSINAKLDIIHPILLTEGIKALIVRSWAVARKDNIYDIKLQCQEYSRNFVVFLDDNANLTNEEIVSKDDITQETIDEAQSELQLMGG